VKYLWLLCCGWFVALRSLVGGVVALLHCFHCARLVVFVVLVVFFAVFIRGREQDFGKMIELLYVP